MEKNEEDEQLKQMHSEARERGKGFVVCAENITLIIILTDLIFKSVTFF